MQTKISKNYTAKSFWKNKSVLITGINGFIGGNLSKYLTNLNAKIIGITNNKIKNKFLEFEKISKLVKISQVSLQNYDEIQKFVNNSKIDVCIHLAAQVDVTIAKTDPLLTFQSNVTGTFNLLESLRKKGETKAIIVASSDKAYGTYPLSQLPYKETYDLRPIFPYDVSKACGDMISKSYSSDLFNLPIIITRFANIYGPGQLNFTALVPDFILEIEKYRKFVPRGNGSNKRDFLYVKDVCVLYTCLAYNIYKDKSLSGEIFNAGTTHGYTVDYIIKTLCDLSNRKDLYFETKKKFKNKNLTGEIKHQFMNFNKLKKYFGWKPIYKLEDGLVETLDWYKKFLKKYPYKYFVK